MNATTKGIEMTPDLKELERLARAATPGPWTYDGDTWELSAPSRKGKVEIATIETGWTEPMESEQQANIAYILAANPAAILSLIAELERSQQLNAANAKLFLEDLAKVEQERDAIYDLMNSKRKYMEELRGALVYHMEQTRPIQRSIDALAIDAAIVKEQS